MKSRTQRSTPVAHNPSLCTKPQTRNLGSVRQGRGLNADTLLAEDVNHQLRRPVVAVDLGAVLEHLDALEVLVEQIGAVHRAALGLRVELGREDGPGLVHHALVAAIVQVDKVLLEVARQGAGINGITVVLAGDVALASGQVKGRDVVSTVAVLELDGLGADGQGQELVAKADTHDGDRRSLHQAAEVVNGLVAVGRVTGAVGDEDTIKVVGNLVDRVVVREHGNRGPAADEAAQDVLLDTAVEQSDVEGGIGVRNDERRLGADTLDQVDLARIDEALVLIGVVLVTNRDPGKRGTLLTQVGDNGAGIDARDGGDALPGAPVAQALDSRPVAVLLGDIGNDNASALDVGGFEILEEVILVTLIRRHTVVADEGLGENQNLATVGGVRHGLGVSHKGSREDGLAGDVHVGAKRLAMEDGTILYAQAS